MAEIEKAKDEKGFALFSMIQHGTYFKKGNTELCSYFCKSNPCTCRGKKLSVSQVKGWIKLNAPKPSAKKPNDKIIVVNNNPPDGPVGVDPNAVEMVVDVGGNVDLGDGGDGGGGDGTEANGESNGSKSSNEGGADIEVV